MEKIAAGNKRIKALIGILILLVLVIGGIVLYTYYDTSNYVSTDNASVAADLYNVTPLASGKLTDFSLKVGDKVQKDQILGRIDGPSSTLVADNNVIRSPIDGVVINVEAQDGEFVASASQPVLAIVIDPKKVYINANVSEKRINYVKVGQKVDVTIDEFGKKTFEGKVEVVGLAAQSEFSILPASTSTFTKIEQDVPVRISINSNDPSLLPGTNAEIKIHVK